MVIAGGNGCGKSALLEALITGKERAGSYGNFEFDRAVVSADAESAKIQMEVAFSEAEQEFVKRLYNESCPERDQIEIEIRRGGAAKANKRSSVVGRLFSYYSREIGSPGFFDYITAYRQTDKIQLESWNASFLSDQSTKETLSRRVQKFQHTKPYLAGLKMRDIQSFQAALRLGTSPGVDSLGPIRETFNRFFAPMEFDDVYLDRSPFGFVVRTPRGEIDIDDLSAGEKEILNIFIRFHQLNPVGSVILFDEADAHLHPDLERRYFEELRRLAGDNQLILTTHSPEMMITAGYDSLFTIIKHPVDAAPSQLIRVSDKAELHDALTDLMGSRGLISFNQRIVFIEGTEASADRAIYEAFYPPTKYNISFVPAGDSGSVRRTAERVNSLLSSSTAFQNYFSIVDRDIDRSEKDPTEGKRLFRLPVYHVENFLLSSVLLFQVLTEFLGSKIPYADVGALDKELQELILLDGHLKPYTRAVLDAELAKHARNAHDAVFAGRSHPSVTLPTFAEIEEKAKKALKTAIDNGTWRKEVKARDLIKSLCAKHGVSYEHFRNSTIAKLSDPPKELDEIMQHVYNS
jgi:predicted ATPase